MKGGSVAGMLSNDTKDAVGGNCDLYLPVKSLDIRSANQFRVFPIMGLASLNIYCHVQVLVMGLYFHPGGGPITSPISS